jgi:hypothetical protein
VRADCRGAISQSQLSLVPLSGRSAELQEESSAGRDRVWTVEGSRGGELCFAEQMFVNGREEQVLLAPFILRCLWMEKNSLRADCRGAISQLLLVSLSGRSAELQEESSAGRKQGRALFR